MEVRKVTLYVKSVKTAVDMETTPRPRVVVPNQGPAPGGMAPPPQVYVTYDVESETRYAYVLPEDQKTVVEMVEQIARAEGLDIEVVDVTKIGRLSRAFRKDLRRLKIFPTLLTDSGLKLEGSLSKEQVERLLRES